MKRKMTDFALALSGMCGGLGASGLYARGATPVCCGQHRREGERAEAAEAVGQKLAAVAGESDMFGHSLSSRTETHSG